MKKIIFTLITSVLLFNSCVMHDIKGNGKIVSVERSERDFSGISLSNVADVNIMFSEEFQLIITTDENIHDFILTEVHDEILRVSNKDDVNVKTKTFVIDVYLPDLKSIKLSGVGDINVLNGKASTLDIHLSGVGNVYALDYEVENINVHSSGVGNINVWATDSLSGKLSGVGNISYKGNPNLNVKVSGVGNLIKL